MCWSSLIIVHIYLYGKKYLKLNTGIPYVALNPNKCWDIGWFFSSLNYLWTFNKIFLSSIGQALYYGIRPRTKRTWLLPSGILKGDKEIYNTSQALWWQGDVEETMGHQPCRKAYLRKWSLGWDQKAKQELDKERWRKRQRNRVYNGSELRVSWTKCKLMNLSEARAWARGRVVQGKAEDVNRAWSRRALS